MPINGQTQSASTRQNQRNRHQFNRAIVGPDLFTGDGIASPFQTVLPAGVMVAVTAIASVPAPTISAPPVLNVTITPTAVACNSLVSFITVLVQQSVVLQPQRPVLSNKPRGAFYNGQYNEIPFFVVPILTQPNKVRVPANTDNQEPVVFPNGNTNG